MKRAAQTRRTCPLGSTVCDGGANFSLFSRSATGVELLFFDREDDAPAGPRDSDRSDDEPHLSLLARVRFSVTMAFYNQRGTAEQWIKKGKNAINWTRLSCRSFTANAVRLQLRDTRLVVMSSSKSHGRGTS